MSFRGAQESLPPKQQKAMCQLPQATSRCTNRFESPWAVCCQNGGAPRTLTGQAGACGNVRRSTTPVHFRGFPWRAPVAHTDASCAQGLTCSGEIHGCSCARAIPRGGHISRPETDRTTTILARGPRRHPLPAWDSDPRTAVVSRHSPVQSTSLARLLIARLALSTPPSSLTSFLAASSAAIEIRSLATGLVVRC